MAWEMTAARAWRRATTAIRERKPNPLPRQCEICQCWSAVSLCADCLQRFAPKTVRCSGCALPRYGLTASDGLRCGACLHEPPPWDGCVAAVDYGFPWDDLIGRFKFGQRSDLAVPLADVLRRALPEASLANLAKAVITAVPLSDQRLAERGFNQAWELARRIASAVGLPAEPALLLRCRDTPHQVGLDRKARQRNLRQALMAHSDKLGAIAGLDIVVVDDVMTTGITAQAVTLALRQAGAKSVRFWVLARTLPGGG